MYEVKIQEHSAPESTYKDRNRQASSEPFLEEKMAVVTADSGVKPTMLKLLIVEDMTLTRSGLRALLEDTHQVEVIGEAADGREAIKLAEELNPDVILMDVSMPGLNGIEAARQIHAGQPGIRILMLSMYNASQYVFESLRAGASGYCAKDATVTELLKAIQTVASGGTYLSSALTDIAVEDYVRLAQGKHDPSELGKLSAREREVLQLITEGHSSAEIARLLHISARTVDTHRHNIMQKLDIHSVAGLTKFAIRHGLSSL
jgi:DNA-binding NarL/FixJ family response regulator